MLHVARTGRRALRATCPICATHMKEPGWWEVPTHHFLTGTLTSHEPGHAAPLVRRHNARAGLLQPRLESDGLPQGASRRLIAHGKDMIADLDFACTSCFRPGTRDPGLTTHSTQDLAEYETPRPTFHDTAYGCHHRGHRFTPVVFDRHARGCSPHSHQLEFRASQHHLPPHPKRHQSRSGLE